MGRDPGAGDPVPHERTADPLVGGAWYRSRRSPRP